MLLGEKHGTGPQSNGTRLKNYRTEHFLFEGNIMKVYRVRPDVNNFQYLMTNDRSSEDLYVSILDSFDRTVHSWEAPSVYVHNPGRVQGDFPCRWGTNSLVIDASSCSDYLDLLEMSGRLLPLNHESKEYSVLHLTECFNCLNVESTVWRYEQGRLPTELYSIHPNRLPEVPLFRIPESYKYEILTVEGMKDADDEFKGRVESLGLTGLEFDEIWSDE